MSGIEGTLRSNGRPRSFLARRAGRERSAPASRDGSGASSSLLRPPDPTRWWVAELIWHAEDDGHCRFRVAARSDDGTDCMLAASAELPWPPADSRSFQALRTAVDGLAATMTGAGWRQAPPADHWYSLRFEWTPTELDAAFSYSAAALLGPSWPIGSENLWRCQIKWRAGWVTSTFEAVVFEPGARRGIPTQTAGSFGWLLRSDPDEESPEQAAAVDELAAALQGGGWEEVRRGRHWYSRRFVWRHGRPPVAPAKDPSSRAAPA